MRTTVIESKLVAALSLVLALAGCGGGGGGNGNATGGNTGTASNTGGSKASSAKSYPGTEDGAKALLAEFIKPGADHATLSKALRPSRADYDAVFMPDLAAKADAVYSPAWDGGQMVIAPKEGQTQVLSASATSDELKSWTGGGAEFPGGWKDVGEQLKPGVTFYRFKFVEPGQDLGMAYDGLAYVNGNWRIFPKPWRVMR
ncbi:MAG TPA: hypothetical protein VEX60_17590 [Pyrinomonadaceae bacterium]|nr:hypothetical protein [Pyrinomonadaceae bacterium]